MKLDLSSDSYLNDMKDINTSNTSTIKIRRFTKQERLESKLSVFLHLLSGDEGKLINL
jgi:hypothetical protein